MSDHAAFRETIRMQAAAFRRLGSNPGAWLAGEFVRRIGVDCTAQPLPKHIERGVPKACFANAGRLVRRRKTLTYCEGYALAPPVPFPLHHGWAIDAENRVIDPTLEAPEACVYVGVPIPREDLRRLTSRDSASVFLDAIGVLRWRYMLERCPELRELLPEENER